MPAPECALPGLPHYNSLAPRARKIAAQNNSRKKEEVSKGVREKYVTQEEVKLTNNCMQSEKP